MLFLQLRLRESKLFHVMIHIKEIHEASYIVVSCLMFMTEGKTVHK